MNKSKLTKPNFLETEQQKKRQLRKYKAIATGLFVLMALVFVVTSILQKNHPAMWIGYVRAFSEAAMVGALADWFAVTALFHHPLGLRIPHTNLIQNKKEQIGDNLGSFVVSNFLAPKNIRPYILKLKISPFVGNWLSEEKNQTMLVQELSHIALDIVQKLEDEKVARLIATKAKDLVKDIKTNQIVANSLEYILKQNDHQRVITEISAQIKSYIISHHQLVRERVKKESFALIPSFVDNALADKITKGLADYFSEVEQNPQHEIRQQITAKLLSTVEEIKENEKWEKELNDIRERLLDDDKLLQYSGGVWGSIKQSLLKELQTEASPLKKYAKKNMAELAQNLKTDELLQHKIDHWVRVTAYKYILKHTHHFSELISTTIGNWEGKELSQKLELEVGKDLQFIRVNGTLVGGLVGLIIYTIAHFFI